MPRKLDGNFIQTGSITTTQLSSNVTEQIAAGGGPRVSSLIYPGDDTAANTVGGQTVYINGSGFETNNAIYINGNAVPSKSFISASNVSFTTPALSAGLYPVYFINTDTGATAIFVPGLTVSADPTWVTSAGSLNASQDEASAWSYSLSANGDAPITYALAVGSSLPSGISLAANGLISGTLSSPPGTETTYTFSVVATDAQNQDSTRQFTVTTTSGEGVLFANNVLLIHADGTNNQNNHAFLDSSNNNFTITRNGNATQGSFSPFSQTGWSNYFDGDNDTLRMSGNVLSGAGNVTIECWVYPETTSVVGMFDGGPNQAGIIRNYPGNSIEEQGSGTAATFSLTPNTWSHFAATFSGGVIKVYVNGVNTGNGTYTGDYAVGTNFDIGGINGGSDGDFKGYISNFRVTKSIVYSSNFTPSTTPLSAIANTTLLTCQSNRFIDNSNNAYAITRNGNTSIQVWSPFAPTAAYSTANVGGSVYFDGSGDYLTTPSNAAFGFGTGDFTIECWIYTNSASTQRIISSSENNGELLLVNSGSNAYLNWFDGSSDFGNTSNFVPQNAWTHIAVTRSSGSVRLFINGTLSNTPATSTRSYGTRSVTIGIYGADNSSQPFNGSISNLRILKGTALYTSNFTPPTSPPTNIANTSLLLNFTNAGIFDQTAKTVMETVGETKISTSVYKYGTGSISYDGSGDYILVKPTQDLEFGSGDFTIEFWWYPTSTSRQGLYHGSFGTDWSVGIDYGAAAGKIGIWASSNGTAWNLITADNSQGQGTTTVSQNAWNHIAYVRNGTTWMLFVNGNRDLNLTGISGTIVNRTTSQKAIGCWFSTGAMAQASGYMDDFRITKGYARYTSNFTPPTAAFKDK